MWWIVLLVVLALAWLVAENKTSRPDGEFLRVHPYRRLLAYIMPTRNESLVFFDSEIDAEPLLAYLEQAKERFGAHITHAVVAAVAIGLAENPPMNRFVVGRRLYQRDERWVTFSMKREKLDRKAKLAVVKLRMVDGETFEELCRRIDAHISEQRSSRRTHDDREFAVFDALPRPILRLAVYAARTLDQYNLLPAWFIEGDGMFTSVFIANLGSLRMGAGYHHLYEWGNCPLFLMVGQVEERPRVVDGKVVVRRVIPVRYTYDERIDDGLNARFGIEAVKRVLENPAAELGCLADDDSDAVALGAAAD